MRKILIIALLYLLFIHVPLYAAHIIIAADNWCPVNCRANSEQEGFMIDIAKKIFGRAGHTVEYENIPWNRTLKMVREGKIHGAVGAYYKDCPDFIFPENELAMIGFSIFTQKNRNWTYTGISSLEEITLGVIAGYSYLDEIDAYISRHRNNAEKIQIIHGANPLERNIKKLLAGRLDAIIATEPVFWYLAHRMEVNGQVRVGGVAVKPEKAYIAFSPALPQSEKYAEILSAGIAELRKSGELKQILSKYGLEDWKK